MDAVRAEEVDVVADVELQLRFRDVMADVPTPVTVITAMDEDRPHGTTVSAFSSLSMNPPMVLVSLNRDSVLLDIVTRRGTFGVNILASEQAGIAMAFARKGNNKFEGINWRSDSGAPRIDGILGWVACDVAEVIPGGDHIIVLGNVRTTEAEPRLPLTYHSRVFGTHVSSR